MKKTASKTNSKAKAPAKSAKAKPSPAAGAKAAGSKSTTAKTAKAAKAAKPVKTAQAGKPVAKKAPAKPASKAPAPKKTAAKPAKPAKAVTAKAVVPKPAPAKKPAAAKAVTQPEAKKTIAPAKASATAATATKPAPMAKTIAADVGKTKLKPAAASPAKTPPKAPLAKPAPLVVVKGNPVSSEYGSRKKLNASELKFFENLLNEKKETLLQEFRYLEDNTMRLNAREGAGDLSGHAYHLADHATETQDREQAFHMASREGKFLYYIEEALDRVRAGTFGICKRCENLIPKARLEAVPTAKMCIQCKQAAEQESAPLPTQAG